MRPIFKLFVQFLYSMLFYLIFMMSFSLFTNNLISNNNGIYKESTILVVNSPHETQNQVTSVKHAIFSNQNIQDLLITFKARNTLGIGIGIYDTGVRIMDTPLKDDDIIIREGSFLETLSTNNRPIRFLNNAHRSGTYRDNAYFLSNYDYVYSLPGSDTLNGVYTITDFSANGSTLDAMISTFESNNYSVGRSQTSLSVYNFVSSNRGLIIFYLLFIFAHLFLTSNEIYFAKQEKVNAQIFYLLGASPMQIYRKSMVRDLCYKSVSTLVAALVSIACVQPLLSTFSAQIVSIWLFLAVFLVSVLIPFGISLVIRGLTIIRLNYGSVSEEVK